jgi:hypothetical protein
MRINVASETLICGRARQTIVLGRKRRTTDAESDCVELVRSEYELMTMPVPFRRQGTAGPTRSAQSSLQEDRFPHPEFVRTSSTRSTFPTAKSGA